MARCITHHDGKCMLVEPSPQLRLENTCAYFQKISVRNYCTRMGVYELELVMDPVQLTSCTLNSGTGNESFTDVYVDTLTLHPETYEIA